MGFGSDLKYSHEALLKLQDWELRLLEMVKKFMAMRIKSDKEYASTLQNLCNQVDKESTSQLDYVSNISKVCKQYLQIELSKLKIVGMYNEFKII